MTDDEKATRGAQVDDEWRTIDVIAFEAAVRSGEFHRTDEEGRED